MMCTKRNLVDNLISYSKDSDARHQTTAVERELNRGVTTVLMVYEMLLLQ